MHRFDWDDVRTFLALKRAGRLATAALQLGIEQSTLSRRVSALEASFGVRLFERRSTGFTLTPEGQSLVSDAESMESLAIRMRARIEDTAVGLTGTLRLGSPEGFGTYFLAPRIAKFCKLHPELEIELVANPRSFSLSKREADLAITMTRPTQGRVYAQKLTDFSLGIYAAESYLALGEPILTRAELDQHRWVGYVEDLMWTAELDYIPNISLSIVPILRISNVISQMAALAGGAGLGVLPNFMARTEPALKRVLSNDVELTRSYWLVAHADTRDVARFEHLAEFIRSEMDGSADFWQ